MSLNSPLAVGPDGSLLETGVKLQINVGTEDKPVWKDLNCIIRDDLDLPEPKPPHYRRLLPDDVDDVPPHPMCRCNINMDFGGHSFAAVSIHDGRGNFIRSIPMEAYECPPHLAKWALNYIRQEKVHNFIKRLKTRLKTSYNASKRS